MEISNLILGFSVTRNPLETLGGARSALPCPDEDSLIVFQHDFKAFAIPTGHVSCLAELYRRYLIASGILDCSVKAAESGYDEEALSYDHTTLHLIHKDLKVPFKNGAFNLDAAINFVEQESALSRTLAIRWCMMMEYITHENQRAKALRKRKWTGEPSDYSEIKDLIPGGVDEE